MDTSTLRSAHDKDLASFLLGKHKALRDFRFGIAGSKIKNVKEGKNLRRDIARILTEMTRRTISAKGKAQSEK